MKLTSMLTQNVQSSQGSDSLVNAIGAKSDNKSNKSTNFENVMNQVETKDNTTKNTKDDRATQKPKDESSQNVNTQEKPKADTTNSDKSANPKEKPVDAPKAEEAAPTKNIADSKEASATTEEGKLLEKIAEIVGMPVLALQQILQQMNLQPADLLQPENLNAFVQKLYNVDNAAGLLLVPDIQNVFKDIQKVLDDFAKNTEFAQLLQVQTKTTTEQTATQTVNTTEKPVQSLNQQATANNAEVDESVLQTEQASKEAVAKVQTTNQEQKPANNFANSQQQNQSVVSNVETEIQENVAMLNVNKVEQVFVKTEAVKNVNTADVIEQIVNKMKVEVKGDVTDVKIRLNPEHLGDVTLKISTQNGIVTAQFYAESQRVKELIEAGFNELRQSLQEQGINVSQLNVSVGQEESEQMQQFTQEKERSSSRIQSILSGIMTEDGEMEMMEDQDLDALDSMVNYRV